MFQIIKLAGTEEVYLCLITTSTLEDDSAYSTLTSMYKVSVLALTVLTEEVLLSACQYLQMRSGLPACQQAQISEKTISFCVIPCR